MGADTIIAGVSMAFAVLALAAAVVQVSIQQSVEARRKGKTDKLAIGDWAVEWPQSRHAVFETLKLLGLSSLMKDPEVLTVPLITISALEEFLRAEAAATHRHPIQRRISSRLVEEPTQWLGRGAGRITGPMLNFRATTRKTTESCWADMMHICGITRRYWPTLARPDAPACDAEVRPATAAVTLHSLLGVSRVMNLRQVEQIGTKITMTSGGASFYVDQYTGPDRPARHAHFTGSPNGRYRILDTMSQHTSESVYAETVWAQGLVPESSRLDVTMRGVRDRPYNNRQLVFPHLTEQEMEPLWKEDQLFDFDHHSYLGTASSRPDRLLVHLATLVEAGENAIITCPRTWTSPADSHDRQLCRAALSWCGKHWQVDPYQAARTSAVPCLPLADVTVINCEFLTCHLQARQWCEWAEKRQSVPVESSCWERCSQHINWQWLNKQGGVITETLSHDDRTILVRLLQSWKLRVIMKMQHSGTSSIKKSEDTRHWTENFSLQIVLTLALFALAYSNSELGNSEENKGIEIELG